MAAIPLQTALCCLSALPVMKIRWQPGQMCSTTTIPTLLERESDLDREQFLFMCRFSPSGRAKVLPHFKHLFTLPAPPPPPTPRRRPPGIPPLPGVTPPPPPPALLVELGRGVGRCCSDAAGTPIAAAITARSVGAFGQFFCMCRRRPSGLANVLLHHGHSFLLFPMKAEPRLACFLARAAAAEALAAAAAAAAAGEATEPGGNFPPRIRIICAGDNPTVDMPAAAAPAATAPPPPLLVAAAAAAA